MDEGNKETIDVASPTTIELETEEAKVGVDEEKLGDDKSSATESLIQPGGLLNLQIVSYCPVIGYPKVRPCIELFLSLFYDWSCRMLCYYFLLACWAEDFKMQSVLA